MMGQIICLPVLPLECHNRTNFVFWDPYHPTDSFNIIASKFAYEGNLQPTFPRNVACKNLIPSMTGSEEVLHIVEDRSETDVGGIAKGRKIVWRRESLEYGSLETH